MKDNNPTLIPRNHLIEEAIAKEDLSILDILKDPYNHDRDLSEYQMVKSDKNYRTYCGTWGNILEPSIFDKGLAKAGFVARSRKKQVKPKEFKPSTRKVTFSCLIFIVEVAVWSSPST